MTSVVADTSQPIIDSKIERLRVCSDSLSLCLVARTLLRTAQRAVACRLQPFASVCGYLHMTGCISPTGRSFGHRHRLIG
eukprot:4515657-Pleurochrysis_carterae.AAC.1